MYFVNFKNAFDSISYDKLWVTMMDMGYPLHLVDFLAKLCRKQLAGSAVVQYWPSGNTVRMVSC